MSDNVECVCGKTGRRRMGRMAPAKWFFLVVHDENDDSKDDDMIAYACSKECCFLSWRKGPGDLEETRGAELKSTKASYLP